VSIPSFDGGGALLRLGPFGELDPREDGDEEGAR